MKLPSQKRLTANEKLKLLRSKDEKIAGQLLHAVERYLRNHLRLQHPDFANIANLLASKTVCIIIEMGSEPVLNCELKTFAISIAKNQWINLKDKKREILEPNSYFNDFESADDVFLEVEKSERKLFVNRCMKKLTTKCNRLLTLYCRDLKSGEAYLEMGYSTKAVYQVKKKECLNRLKVIMENLPEYSELFEKNLEAKKDGCKK